MADTTPVLFGFLWLVAAVAVFIYAVRTPGKLLTYVSIGLLAASAIAFIGAGFPVQVVIGVHVFLIAIVLGEIVPSDLFWLYFIITSVIITAWYYLR